MYVFHGFAVALQEVGESLRTDGDGAAHELRDVVAAEELAVVVGVGLRQLEGLAELAVAVDMGKEGAGEVAVVAAAADDEPAAV